MMNLLTLAVVLAAALAPTFLFASKIDVDEFQKSGTGVLLAGIVLAIYKIFEKRST